MAPALTFDPQDGTVRIEGYAVAIAGGMSNVDAAAVFAPLYRSIIDHNNGYQWLSFDGVALDGEACGISLCFHLGKLTEVRLGVALPGATVKDAWPTREAIDEEIGFVRAVFQRCFARSFRTGQERFAWGVAWADFDAKGFQASAGLRYNA